MKSLSIVAGVFLLLPVLFNHTYAEEQSLPFNCPQEELDLASIEDFSTNWLDGTVCFEGKKATRAEQPYLYAKAHRFPFSSNGKTFWSLVSTGRFVPIKPSTDLPLQVLFSTSFVLRSTADFVQQLAQDYSHAGCGDLIVTGGGRFVSYGNSHSHSVHPMGMAIDIRIRTLSQSCFQHLSTLLYEAEANRVADSTRERWPPHFHVVVVPEPPVVVVTSNAAQSNPSD